MTATPSWVTNKSGNSESNRNIIALADLGESTNISNPLWASNGTQVPSNRANTEYDALLNNYAEARDISQATNILDAIPGFEGSIDYEKLQSARKLSTSEYTLNSSLGFISLSNTLQTDDVLAVAYEYTYGGVTYQVGAFASDEEFDIATPTTTDDMALDAIPALNGVYAAALDNRPEFKTYQNQLAQNELSIKIARLASCPPSAPTQASQPTTHR